MYINNNHTSFHLWWQEYLLKHKQVSRYYENDCRSVLLKVMNTEVFNNFEEIRKKRDNHNKLLVSLAAALQ